MTDSIPTDHDDLMYQVPGARLREMRAAEARAERAEAALRQIAALHPFSIANDGAVKAPAIARAALAEDAE